MSKGIKDFWNKNSIMETNEEFTDPVLDHGEGSLHCPYCNRKIFEGHLGPGSKISVKCSRRECGKIFLVNKL